MNKELQDKLFEMYPKIFRQKDLPMQQTAMCWGITCGDGWYNIINTLCGQIQNHLEYNMKDNDGTIVIEATQVKEKYGSLRFYHTGGDEFIRGLCWMAEGLSCCTCEECGAPGSQNSKGWIHTLCEQCRNNIAEIRKKSVEDAHQKITETHKSAFQQLDDDGTDLNQVPNINIAGEKI